MERPILFSGEMVKAILSGVKSQTRRVVKPQPAPEITEILHAHGTTFLDYVKQKHGQEGERVCPYSVGMKLWVRETWRLGESNPNGMTVSCYNVCDEEQYWMVPPREWLTAYRNKHRDYPSKLARVNRGNKPSIFMPRWASRITLEVESVMVERVQDITHRDALVEGVTYDVSVDDGAPLPRFEKLWDSINGKRPGCAWADNPWVWKIAFRRVTP